VSKLLKTFSHIKVIQTTTLETKANKLFSHYTANQNARTRFSVQSFQRFLYKFSCKLVMAHLTDIT